MLVVKRLHLNLLKIVIFFVIGRLDHHAIDNGNVEVHPPEYPFEYTSEYFPDPDTTTIKSIDDDEMEQLL